MIIVVGIVVFFLAVLVPIPIIRSGRRFIGGIVDGRRDIAVFVIFCGGLLFKLLFYLSIKRVVIGFCLSNLRFYIVSLRFHGGNLLLQLGLLSLKLISLLRELISQRPYLID